MGRESASYELELTAAGAAALARRLEDAGVELLRAGELRSDYCLRDPHRYWIDLRVHHEPPPRLQIRIALTNDTWAIRAPLERVLTPLPAELEGTPMRDDVGAVVAGAGGGWLLALQDDYERRRDEFVARVGDYSAPLSADHVYMYLHQTRWNQDNDDELAWHREREIARLEAAWEDEAPEPEAGDS